MQRLVLVLGVILGLLSAGTARAATQDLMDFYDQIKAELLAGNYDALEAAAEELRRDDRRFDGGVSKIFLFYRVLVDRQLYSNFWFFGRWPQMTEEEFQRRRPLLEAWQKARPDSATARVALAALWNDFAWAGRGHEFSSKVGAAQWQDFRARLQNEESLLDGLSAIDPGVFEIMLDYARDCGWTRESIDRLYQRAVRKYPTYFHFYLQHALLLDPKWYGKPGELYAYANSLLADPGGEAGLMAYSVVVGKNFHQRDVSRYEFFEKTGLRWSEVKAGYALREQRYGLSNGDWNLLLYFASGVGDRETALRATEQIGENWASWIWGKRGPFDQSAAWARQPISGQ